MDKKKDIERIKKHILVLNKAYDNIVEVMEEDVEKKKDDEGNDIIALKDDKIKTYADGIKKSAETLNYLYSEIVEKEKELSTLKKEKGVDVVDEKPKVQKKSNLSDNLN